MPRYAEVSDVRAIAPELSEVDDAVITVWAGVARTWIDLSRWGEQALEGHRQLTAHLVALAPDGLGLGVGTLTGAGVGPVNESRSVTVPPDEMLNLSATPHGLVYSAVRAVVASTGTGILSNTAIRLG